MSIRTKLIIMFLTMALIPTSLVGYLAFINFKSAIQKSELRHLQDILTFKTYRLETYFSILRTDMEITLDRYLWKKNLPLLAKEPNNPGSKILDEEIKKTQTALSTLGVVDILIITNGKVVYSIRPQPDFSETAQKNPSQKNALEQGKKGIFFSDIYYDYLHDKRFEMMVTAPINDFNNTFVGLVVFEVDMKGAYDIVQEPIALGKTGEAFVGKKVGDELIFLSPLKLEPSWTLTKKIKIGSSIAEPLQEAVQGKTGAGIRTDYRGEQVFAAWGYLPHFDWGMVVKIDSKEALADATNVRNLSILIFSIVLVLSTIMALSEAQSLSAPIKNLTRGAEIIGKGNLGYKIRSDQKDEIGQLSRAFNKMTTDLQTTTASRDELNREVEERKKKEEELEKLINILKALKDSSMVVTQAQDENSLLEGICKIITEECGYAMAAVLYAENDANKTLRPIVCSCLDQTIFKSMKFSWGDNELGQGAAATAIRTGKIEIFEDIQHNKRLTQWSKLIEREGYNSAIGIPLKISSVIFGAVTLFSYQLQPCTENEKNFLLELANDMSAGISFIFEKNARIEAQNNLRRSLEQLELATEAGGVGTWDYDIVNNKVSFDTKGKEMFGLEHSEEMTYEKTIKIIHPDDHKLIEKTISQCIVENKEFDIEFRALPHGREHWFYAKGHGFFNESKQCIRMAGVFIDITERKKSTEALRESEERFRKMADAMHQLVWIAKPDGYIFWYNQRWYEYTGTTPEQMEGWGWQSVHDPAILPAVLNKWKSSIAKGEQFEMEFPLRRADGCFRQFLTRSVPLKDAKGQVLQWFGTNTDIEDITEAQKALAESEEKYRTLFESIDEGFCIIQVLFDENEKPYDYVFILVNPAFQYQSGISDAVGKKAKDIMPMLEQHWIETFGRVALTGQSTRYENYASDLNRFFEVYTFRTGNPEERKVALIFTDITKRKKDEQQIKEINEELMQSNKELLQVNRILKALSDSSKAMTQVEDEKTFYNEICEIVNKDIGYPMVMITQAFDDEEKTVKPVAYGGFAKGYVESLKLSWGDNDYGRGPTGTAIRTGQWFVLRDISASPRFEAWRDEALKQGYISVIAFPLKEHDKPFGTLTVFASTSDSFLPYEIDLLNELANDVAVGITIINARLRLQDTNEKLKELSIDLHHSNKELTKANRVLRALSDSNQAMMQAEDETSFLKQICEIVNKTCGYSMVTIVFAKDDPEKTLELKAYAGFGEEYAKNFKLSWGDNEYGQGPCGTAIRSRKPVISKNIMTDPLFEPWIEKAQKAGYVSAMSIPLTRGVNEAIGSLNVFSDKADAFSEDEVKLLSELANDLAAGIVLIETRLELKHSNQELSTNKIELEMQMEELRTMQVRLQESQKQFADLFNLAPVGYVILDKHRVITMANFSAAAILKREIKYLVGKPLAVYVSSKSKDDFFEHIEKVLEENEKQYCELELKLLDNSLVDVSLQSEAIEDENGVVTGCRTTIMDITERRQAQEAIERQAELIDLSPDAIIVRQLDGTVKFWSEGAEMLYGWTREEAIGMSTHKLFQTRFPEPMDEILTNLQHEGRWSGELVHRNKDGGEVTVQSRWLARYDAKGQVAEILESNVDITERKQAEEALQELNEKLKQSNKEYENFADIVSHDLREPLRAISGFVELLKMKYSDKLDENANRYIDFAFNGAKNMRTMLLGLLEYSRVQSQGQEFAAVDMNKALKDAMDNLLASISENKAQITNDKLPVVEGDESQLVRLLQNLIHNGLKYRKEENPKIHIGCKRRDKEWLFSVSDNGIGISQYFQKQLFTIFKREHKKKEVKGEGIGLAVCRRIVERHKGKIWAQSEEDKGSIFYFTIPAKI